MAALEKTQHLSLTAITTVANKKMSLNDNNTWFCSPDVDNDARVKPQRIIYF